MFLFLLYSVLFLCFSFFYILFSFYISLSSIFCSLSIFLFLLYSVLFLYFSFFYILFSFYISLSSILCSVVHIHGHSQVSSVSKFTVSSPSVLVPSLLLSQLSQYRDVTITILTRQPHKYSFHLYTSASHTKGSLTLSIHHRIFS